MRRVIYAFNVSLDGYIESPAGDLNWSDPDEELHRYFNALEDGLDTHLYGRRLWELMSAFWPTADEDPEAPSYIAEYAEIWRSKQNVVFSRTLERVPEGVTLLREVDPGEIRRLKAQPGKDLNVGGAELAAEFMRHDLIDEYQLVVHPVVLGGGKPMLGALAGPLDLRLVEVHPFASGVVSLRYERPRA